MMYTSGKKTKRQEILFVFVTLMMFFLIISFYTEASKMSAVSAAGNEKNSEQDDNEKSDDEPTVKKFLENCLKPMGTTMYIYGGGWNEEDTGAGEEARTLGVSPKWAEFATEQTADYNYKNYDYKKDVSVIHLGLDCSGYAGWAIYNTLEKENGKEGYVDYKNKVLERLEKEGYGTLTLANGVKDYKAGDIMKTDSHMWIVVGSCEDGSVVLMHASPPGVMISGTTTPSGKKNSQANTLATYYMKKYYKSWYDRYPDSSRGVGYLSGYNQFRWEIKDPEGLQNMNAAQVLYMLFGTSPEGFETEGSWRSDSNGWWFQNMDGTYPKAQWKKIGGIWYYFNADGYMATGWVNDGGIWYYMKSDGAMQTGWMQLKGIWYYMKPDGAMQTGWLQDSGKWYYMNQDGAMLTGWVESGGKWYYLKSNGTMAVSEKIGNYTVGADGSWTGR